MSSRRIVLVVKMVIFEKWQKVFDNGLGKKKFPIAMRLHRVKWHI